MECGAQYVMMVSATLMLELLADSSVIPLTADMEELDSLGMDLFLICMYTMIVPRSLYHTCMQL